MYNEFGELAPIDPKVVTSSVQLMTDQGDYDNFSGDEFGLESGRKKEAKKAGLHPGADWDEICKKKIKLKL